MFAVGRTGSESPVRDQPGGCQEPLCFYTPQKSLTPASSCSHMCRNDKHDSAYKPLIRNLFIFGSWARQL